MTWSCNAKADVPYETLKVLKDNGLRLLLVGYESGNQQILNNVKKGIRLDNARRFTRDAKSLGITIHGTFIFGLPGETTETIQETIRFARDIDPHTVQASIAAPYAGTALHRQALAEGWLAGSDLVDDQGVQRAALSYPHLSSARDLLVRGDVLQALLLPPAEDLEHRRRDAARSSGHEATPARGHRVHTLSREARPGIGGAPPRPARAPRRVRLAARAGSDGIPKCSR